MAPNLSGNAYLFRPLMAEPPLCSLAELKTVLTIDDLANLHEILNFKEAAGAKAEKAASQAAQKR